MPLVRNNQSVSSWWCNGASFILLWEMWCVDGIFWHVVTNIVVNFRDFLMHSILLVYITRVPCKNTKMLSNFEDIFLDAT